MTLKAIFSGATLLLMMASPALAGQRCAPHDMVVDRLASRYGEARQSMGLGTNNSVIEVFASDETGTWTITVTSAEGVTCLVASGQAYVANPEALPAKGEDA